ncbi:MAG: hypothetical protein BJ554DRAFT_1020 [Olpidium bornovanus]|uniref:Inner membrane component domain-containing protein n=1 Tax=Olpidium bornovanus TaxID=278681 RepID=A0A8H8DI51_9FUNG|nr:MAG: hypothetical protein BJ554DRAFT_1020 [Olpidium bornovanus]
MSQLFKVAFGGRRKKSRARLLQAMPAPSSTVVEGTGVGGVGGGGEGGKPSSSGSSGRGAAAAQQQDRNGDSLEEAYPQRKSYQSSRGGGVGGKRRRRTTSENSSQSASSGRSSRRAAHPNGDGLSSDGDGGGGGGDDDDDYDDDEGGFDSEIDGEYTIKDRQDVLNLSHPFGVRLWKPALYKKDRSINRLTIAALHASPTDSAELYLSPGNVFYAAVFGWWLSLVTFVIAAVLAVVPTQDGRKYASTLRGLAGYIFWPFGKYVETAVSAEEALEAGTSTHGVDDVREPLLGLATGVGHAGRDRRHARLTFAGCLYYLFFYGLLGV